MLLELSQTNYQCFDILNIFPSLQPPDDVIHNAFRFFFQFC